MGTHPQRPKIALTVPSLAQGGGVPAVARFLKNAILRSGRYELQLVSLSMSSKDSASLNVSSPKTWRRGAVTENGIWDDLPFVHVGAEAGELEFQRYRRRKVLAEVLADCDLIQLVCGSPAWANSVVGLGKPVSLQVATRVKVERRRRDGNSRRLADWWRKAMTQITDKLDDRALRIVDAIQLENPWMLDYSRRINQGRSGVDIRYAPPGVDARRFAPASERHSSPAPYVLCVGRLDDPRKHMGLLLEAFHQLPAKLAHVHLVTAGSGRPPPEYWSRVEALGMQGRVRHIHRPETDDLVKLYQQASVFALSSDEEGLGVVILEAMACGVPVVATRCGGPDGIITQGKDGYLVPLNDVAAMSDRLALLCTDHGLNRRLGLRGRKTIEDRYAEEVAEQAFVDVWERLLQKTGKC